MTKFIKNIVRILGVVCIVAFALTALGVVPEGSGLSHILGWFAGGGAVMAAVGVTPENETIVKGAVAAGDVTPANAPSYMAGDYDKALIKIRPSDFPIDTITRVVGNTVQAKSLVVNGFELGTRDCIDKVVTATEASAADGTVSVKVGKIGMWMPNDLLIVGSGANAKASDGKPMTLYVVKLDDNGTNIVVKAVNKGINIVPALAADTVLIRTSCAVSEDTAKVDGWNSQPGDYENYCQIHMGVVAETVIHALMDKKTDYNFKAMRDQQLYDMKMGMERANLIGVKGKFNNANNKIVYTSDGLYSQCSNLSTLRKGSINDAALVTLGRETFENNNGSSERIFIAGNGLLEAMAQSATYVKQLESRNPETVLGVKFNRITTPFGDLLVKPMGSLFSGDFANRGLIVDPQYITRKVLETLKTEELNLNKTGQSRVNAVRVVETYCLMMQNPAVHRKVELVSA